MAYEIKSHNLTIWNSIIYSWPVDKDQVFWGDHREKKEYYQHMNLFIVYALKNNFKAPGGNVLICEIFSIPMEQGVT